MGCWKITNIRAKIIPDIKQPKTVLGRLLKALVLDDLIAIIECVSML
jgi:hypothetical protein